MRTMNLNDLERLAGRERPEGQPIMHQSWGKLLFIHWRIDAEALRPSIPSKLEIDTFDGSAWIAIAPFTMWNTRAAFLPRSEEHTSELQSHLNLVCRLL